MPKDRGRTARIQAQMAQDAARGAHWAAGQAAAAAKKFKPGDTVCIRRNGKTAKVQRINRFDMYVLEGYSGAFGANDIEAAPDN